MKVNAPSIAKLLITMIDDFIAEKKKEGKKPTFQLMKKELSKVVSGKIVLPLKE